MLMPTLLAHAGEEHAVEQSEGIISAVWHWPTWAAMVLVLCLLGLVYVLAAKLFRLGFAGRLLVLVGSAIVLGVVYLPHNPTVTALVLSGGFIITFLLTFTLLGGGRKGR